MKNTIKFLAAMRSIAIIALVAVIGFGVVSCGGDDDGGGGGGGGGGLKGTITISPAGPVIVGTKLTAQYTGEEPVYRYEWKKGSEVVSQNPTFKPGEAGSYTVTALCLSDSGSQETTTSAPVTVNPAPLVNLPQTASGSKTAWRSTGDSSAKVYFTLRVYDSISWDSSYAMWAGDTQNLDGTHTITVTTNLSAPNDTFTLTNINSGYSKLIDGLSVGQVVTWTATTTTGGGGFAWTTGIYDICLIHDGKAPQGWENEEEE